MANTDTTASKSWFEGGSFPHRRRTRDNFLVLALFGLIVASGFADETNHGLTAGPRGEARLHGKAFRGIGMNYYDAFARLLGDGKTGDVEAGIRVLASNQIPFIRFSAGGYWPVDWQLYQTNRQEYFDRLDSVVKLAERSGIGLIPSLFWHPPTISDLVGEPVDRWGDPASKTHTFMRAYTSEVVTRYRDSSAIWAWEFGNEFNLPADLPNAADHRAPVQPRLGTAASRSAGDDLTHADIRIALAEFAREVRRHDTHRLILSGNAFPRDSAWHQQREKNWERDTPGQWAEMLTQDNPAPVSSLSGRLYSTNDLARLASAMAQSRLSGRPLMIGEFGVPGAMNEETRRQFREQLEALEANGVSLAALWVFDFEGQAKDWNVTERNARSEQLRLIGEVNARWKTKRIGP